MRGHTMHSVIEVTVNNAMHSGQSENSIAKLMNIINSLKTFNIEGLCRK